MELSPAKRVEGFDDDDDDYDDRVECENQYCEESGRLIIKLNDDDGWTWSSENWKQSYDILLILILDFFLIQMEVGGLLRTIYLETDYNIAWVQMMVIF